MRSQSVASAVGARAWQAAIAACSAYGPRPSPRCASSSARASAASPRRMSRRSQRDAVLVEQQDRFAVRADARAQARGLELHQRHEAVHLRLVAREPGEDASEPQRFFAQRRPGPVVARGGRVAFVEDQVDHLEHRREARGQFGRRSAVRRARVPRRACAWHARCAARSSAPARGRRVRSRRWSGRRAAAASARCALRATAPGWHAMKIRRSRSSAIGCVEGALDGGVEVGRRVGKLVLDLVGQRVFLARVQFAAADHVDGTMLRGGREPCRRVVRHAADGPLLERGTRGRPARAPRPARRRAARASARR